ncbi:MAG: SurA N-terminal domain-containing protein [Chloroflexota bacterium]|nr:SurA N-terminal domain-containing protein [Chloroflexota bacterium]
MAKKVKKRTSNELTRKQVSRLERERRMERIIKWSVTGITIVVVGVLAYGFIVENVVKARESVATVGDVPITTSEFQARVRFTRMQMRSELQYLFQQQEALDPTDPNVQFYLEYIQNNLRDMQSQLSPENALIIGEQALEQLIQEELVRQEAERQGITVSDEELQEAIEQFFGYERNPATPTPAPTSTSPLTPTDMLDPTVTPFPTPTPVTEQEFSQRYDNFLKNLRASDVSEQQYRSWVKSSLLLEKLQEQMSAEAPTTADQVKLRYLSVDSEERANELSARLNAGEDFQTLADELEEDEEAGGYSYELEWFPKSVLERNLSTELANLAFSLEVGEHSQPVLGQDGTWYTIIEVMGHEVRDLDQFIREQMGNDAFQEWLESQQVLVERSTYRDRVPTDP